MSGATAGAGPARLRLEPWAPSHAGSLQDGWSAEDEPATPEAGLLGEAAVSVEVPLAAWKGLRPTVPADVARVLFLDGVRRVEARVVLEGGSQAFGVLGSTAVGAVECDLAGAAPAKLAAGGVVERWCVVNGDGQAPPDVLVPGRAGGPPLPYRGVAAAGTEYQAPAAELQRRMREAEVRLARELLGPADGRAGGTVDRRTLLVADGPRPLLGADPRVVGYLKTVQQQRLPAAAFAAVRRLEAGERSPVYLVGEGRNARFEWYLRLRDPRPWLHSLAGAVRLQAHAGEEPEVGLARAREVADWSALELPRFATRAHQDPRAPQQLLPVRALEEALRRRLGSGPLLRRRMEVVLAGEGSWS